MGITEKIYEFLFLAGNMVLSAVRYTQVILPGMQHCIISSQIFLFLVYVTSPCVHLYLSYCLLCPFGVLLYELKTDDYHRFPRKTVSQQIVTCDFTALKRTQIRGLRRPRTTEQNV